MEKSRPCGRDFFFNLGSGKLTRPDRFKSEDRDLIKKTIDNPRLVPRRHRVGLRTVAP